MGSRSAMNGMNGDQFDHRLQDSIRLTVFDEGDDAVDVRNGNPLIAAYASSGHSSASPLSSTGSRRAIRGSGNESARDNGTETDFGDEDDEQYAVDLNAEDEPHDDDGDEEEEQKEESRSASIVFMDSDHDSDSEDKDSDDNEISERNMRYIRRRGTSMINIDLDRLAKRTMEQGQRRKSYSARFDFEHRNASSLANANSWFDRSALMEEQKDDGRRRRNDRKHVNRARFHDT